MVMKSRYNPVCVCVSACVCVRVQQLSTTPERNVPGRVKGVKMLNTWPSELLKPESHIPHRLDTSWATERSGVPSV